MAKANLDIRKAASDLNIPLWRIADRYGITDSNFSRLLRKELPEEKRNMVLKIIADLKAETQNNGKEE